MAGVAGGWDGKNGNPGVSLYALKCVMETEHTISAIRLAATNSLHSVYLLDSTRLHYGYGCHILNCSYAGRFWPDSPIDKAEWAAVNYAYENKALVVAGKGQHDRQDENIDPGPLYPAGLDPQKVLSVGASIANKRKPIYSFWKYNMDILAPGGDCAIQSERLAYTTFGEYDYNCFSHTSASTAYATGVAALIHGSSQSWPTISHAWGIEPEDYQGLIASSALDLKNDQIDPDIRYKDYFDDASGHGHLQADKLYDMLEDNYVLYHMTIHNWNQDTSSFTFDRWTGPHNIEVVTDRTENGDKILRRGWYKANMRNIFFEKVISIEDFNNYNPFSNWLINNTHKAHIWTRGGTHTEKARSGFGPRYQNNISKMQSGYGGMPNGMSMRIHDNENGDTKKVKVKIQSLQFEFIDGPGNNFSYPKLIPANENIAATFSVFVKTVTDSATTVFDEVVVDKYTVNTNLEENKLYIIGNEEKINVISLVLLDILGNEVTSRFGESLNSLSIRNVSSGFYFLVISDEFNNSKTVKIRIVR